MQGYLRGSTSTHAQNLPILVADMSAITNAVGAEYGCKKEMLVYFHTFIGFPR